MTYTTLYNDINTQNEKVLPNSIKALLIDSVTIHFSQIEPVDEVVSVGEPMVNTLSPVAGS